MKHGHRYHIIYNSSTHDIHTYTRTYTNTHAHMQNQICDANFIARSSIVSQCEEHICCILLMFTVARDTVSFLYRLQSGCWPFVHCITFNIIGIKLLLAYILVSLVVSFQINSGWIPQRYHLRRVGCGVPSVSCEGFGNGCWLSDGL